MYFSNSDNTLMMVLIQLNIQELEFWSYVYIKMTF